MKIITLLKKVQKEIKKEFGIDANIDRKAYPAPEIIFHERVNGINLEYRIGVGYRSKDHFDAAVSYLVTGSAKTITNEDNLDNMCKQIILYWKNEKKEVLENKIEYYIDGEDRSETTTIEKLKNTKDIVNIKCKHCGKIVGWKNKKLKTADIDYEYGSLRQVGRYWHITFDFTCCNEQQKGHVF